jgi:hypothetical protein
MTSKDAWNINWVPCHPDSFQRFRLNIDRFMSSSDLLSNAVTGLVIDADLESPGRGYADSLRVQLIYPNGSGALNTATVTPDALGRFSYAGIPIGNHVLRVIHLPPPMMSYQIAVSRPEPRFELFSLDHGRAA